MGITARGAWKSVQRHFREMGLDVQTDAVHAWPACGDMSGDVFGNGMLLSKAIKLVAAFDHRHIFIDPDPDPAVSLGRAQAHVRACRARAGRTTTAKLISKGGGVYPRTLKSIPLCPRQRARRSASTPTSSIRESLINAILKAPVDLLWFGGIGTYVQAPSTRPTPQVGDPANDALRVSGSDIRAKVDRRGRQPGRDPGRPHRVRARRAAGSTPTSSTIRPGVDCSDNEVNIKIALDAAQARRAADLRSAASRCCAAMTDEVAALVLEDNRLQALALSIAETRRATRAPPASDPADRDARGQRRARPQDRGPGRQRARSPAARADGHGLTRPELAVLLSSAKLVLQAEIEQTRPGGRRCGSVPLLLGDVPRRRCRAPSASASSRHRLRSEIVATVVANDIVNRMGLVHPFELAEEEGAGLGQVAAAFVSAVRPARHGRDLGRRSTPRAMPEAARLLLFEQAASAAARPHGRPAARRWRGGHALALRRRDRRWRRRAGRARRRPARRRRRAAMRRRSPPTCSRPARRRHARGRWSPTCSRSTARSGSPGWRATPASRRSR